MKEAKFELLTVNELSRCLKVSPSWIRQQTYKGRIPHVRLGRCVRYRLGDVLRALGLEEPETGKTPTE